MPFDYVLGVKEIPQSKEILYREAIRAVIFSNGSNLLLVRNSNGDYKFPGGGIEGREKHIEALRREVLEEIGVIIKDKIITIGTITEQRIDNNDENVFFIMKSLYYLCSLDKYTDFRKLDEYEKELSFELEEVDVNVAYDHNSKLLTQGKNCSQWLKRELLALDFIKANYEELRTQLTHP